ncbi:SDR family NAD(P)-dependent oxidoreductase [Candidatus Amarobacter glycogenicus]|uniref:SDR family NAD(P)-dependent oxidoreductase n=1 Tax=Candidatus Amarobacter glycogenicus TaxID=3140699 RepID=UPI002A11BFB9|nr:SDR family NAD(P)-dependent oxidoreductase [Dehalococcoidia bacterium]
MNEIKAIGGDAVANPGDVGSYEDCFNMVKQAMDTYGRLDAVVANAGILRDLALHNMAENDWDLVIRVHLKQCYNLIHHAWPVFRQQAYGRVVMATSSSGLVGNFGQGNYGAAKAGMLGLMNVAKIEGEKYNIMVNLISPGAQTRMTENLMGRDPNDAERAQVMAPDHVAPAVTYLSSPSARKAASASTPRVAAAAARRSSSPRASATTRISSRMRTGSKPTSTRSRTSPVRGRPGTCAKRAKAARRRRGRKRRPNRLRPSLEVRRPVLTHRPSLRSHTEAMMPASPRLNPAPIGRSSRRRVALRQRARARRSVRCRPPSSRASGSVSLVVGRVAEE